MKDKEPTEELVVVDVQRYKKIKNALNDSEARYRLLFESMPIGIFRFSADGKILDANPALLKMLGYAASTEIEQKNQGKKDKNILKILREFCAKIENQNEFRSFDLTWQKKDNTPFSIRVNARMVSAGDNNAPFYEGTVEDISERQRAEDHIRFQAHILKCIEQAVIVTTPAGIIIYVNRFAETLYGWSATDAIGQNIMELIVPQITSAQAQELMSALRHERNWQGEFLVQRQDGIIFPAYVIDTPIMDERGNISAIVGISSDITERKRAESQKEAALEALRAALAGKEVLLKEVHHRVKNNLATIIGLLQMQHETTTDPAALSLFQELEGRIHSIALVHETLYSSESLARIDIQDYLEKLIAKLRAAMAPDREFRISVAAAGVELGLDYAIPCGLILNELLTNAFKYAFPGNQPRAGEKACEITIAVKWDGGAWDDGVYTLTVADNGVGLPVDLDWAKTKTLGLRLVRMLGEFQLNGRVELDRSQGTSFRLVFASRPGAKG